MFLSELCGMKDIGGDPTKCVLLNVSYMADLSEILSTTTAQECEHATMHFRLKCVAQKRLTN